MTDRRSFLRSTSALALGALPPGVLATTVPTPRRDALSEIQQADPIRNLVIVNGLGGLDETYAPPVPGPPALITARALAAGKPKYIRCGAAQDREPRTLPEGYPKVESVGSVHACQALEVVGGSPGSPNISEEAT